MVDRLRIDRFEVMNRDDEGILKRFGFPSNGNKIGREALLDELSVSPDSRFDLTGSVGELKFEIRLLVVINFSTL